MGTKMKTRPSAAGTRLRNLAAGLAFAAELVHLWAFSYEFTVFPTRGLPLLPVAAVQGVLAVGLLFGAGRWTIGFGIVFNLAVASGWAFTRIVGVPSGGVLVRMPVGLLDLVATATEAALVAALVGMLADPRPSFPSRGRDPTGAGRAVERPLAPDERGAHERPLDTAGEGIVMSRPGASNKRLRDTQRIVHLVGGLLLGVYIYIPLVSGTPPYFVTVFVQLVVFPAIVATGVLMWQGPRMRKLLRTRREKREIE